MTYQTKTETVFVSGSFNVLHPGHLRLLRFAKECGNHLIVGVLSDRLAGKAALIAEKFRLEMVKANTWVDEAFLLDEPITDLLMRLKPDIVIKGKEHEKQFNPESSALETYGGKLLFGSGEVIFSSLDLIYNEFYKLNLKTISIPEDYLARHGLNQSSLVKRVEKFVNLRVCVVGDLIIDEYITCQPLGMSQEDPTIVVTPIDSTRFVGGAGIVAAHAAGLGAHASLISITGADTIQRFAEEGLKSYGVDAHLICDEHRPTTLKQRFRSKGKTLLRVSHLHQDSISVELQSKVLKAVENKLENTDLLIFSDFNYGCLPQPLIDKIIALVSGSSIMMAADSQSSSQIGDISRFMGMDLVTPTEREARLSTRNSEDGLVTLAEQLRQRSKSKNILLKLGEEGVLVHAGHTYHDQSEGWLTDQVPALNRSAKDVAGAGDSLLVASALTLAAGGTIWEAAFLGSLAAAIQVGRVGNIPVLAEDLFNELSR